MIIFGIIREKKRRQKWQGKNSEPLPQSERVRKSIGERKPEKAATEKGFRRIKEVEGILILLPTRKESKKYRQQVARFRARAAIEPCISFKKLYFYKIFKPVLH